MKTVIDRLQAAGPVIAKILSTSSTAGLAIGILHHGEIIHTAGYGFRDVERKLPMDENTAVALFSLTKGMAASAIATLVDENKLTWDTPLINVLPAFKHENTIIQNQVTIRDLLVHRAGFAQYNALWMQDQGRLYIPKDQALLTASTLPITSSFREKFQYNNWNYGLLTLAFEEISGTTLGKFLTKTFFEPMGMTQTSIVREEAGQNISEAYMSLSDGGTLQIERPWVGDDQIMFAANGVRSSVKDLLVFYNALMSASEDQISKGSNSTANSPFKLLNTVLSSQIPIPGSSLLERSYAMGFFRSQIPNVLSASSMNGAYVSPMPVIAQGSESQIVIHHGGNSAASQNAVLLLPKTKSAIIVLSNTMANGDASNWAASALLEALLDSPEKNDFLSLAEKAAEVSVSKWDDLRKSMEKSRATGTVAKPPSQYTGKYWNRVGTWFLEVYLEDGNLTIAFQGDRKFSHVIEHYQDDSFSWLMMQDENAASGRFPYTSPGQWLLHFKADGEDIKGMRWNQNGINEGEYFHKGEYCDAVPSIL